MSNDFITPETWGWKEETLASWMAAASGNPLLNECVPARIIGREHHIYEVVCPDFRGRPSFTANPFLFEQIGRFSNVRVSGKFEYTVAGSSDFPVVGDWVLVESSADAFRIQHVLERRSALTRLNAGTTSEEQVLASNIDLIFLVFALDGGRNFLLRFLERALVVGRNSGAQCCIVLNKADLATPEERLYALEDARRAAPSVDVVLLSAKTSEGVGELASLLSPGGTGCMLGKSGVGKSALVNALASTEYGAVGTFVHDSFPQAREGAVRQDDLRGRHTTTSSHLYRLDSGLLLIDSPGIRELKLWGDAQGLESAFPEIALCADRCRFSNCTHNGEPGCAVQEALVSGELEQARYLAYQELSKEQAWMERRTDERARQEYEQKWKQISKYQKELKKNRR